MPRVDDLALAQLRGMELKEEGMADELTPGALEPGVPVEQTQQADVAWEEALAALRVAAQAGLPSPAARAGIAQELREIVAQLRGGTPVPARRRKRLPPIGVPTVQIWRDGRRIYPYRVRMDQKLWNALGGRGYAALQVAAPGDARIVQSPDRIEHSHYVTSDQHGPFFYCAEASLNGLPEGIYRAEVRQRAIVLGARVGEDEPDDAAATS